MFRDLITRALGRRPSIKRIKEIQAELRSELEHLERLEQAERAEYRKPPEQRLRKRSSKAGPGRRPGETVVIYRKWEKTWVQVGRALWYQLDSPERFDIQIINGKFTLVCVTGDVGWKVISRNRAPIITCTSADDLVPPDGEYEAEIINRSIRLVG